MKTCEQWSLAIVHRFFSFLERSYRIECIGYNNKIFLPYCCKVCGCPFLVQNLIQFIFNYSFTAHHKFINA